MLLRLPHAQEGSESDSPTFTTFDRCEIPTRIAELLCEEVPSDPREQKQYFWRVERAFDFAVAVRPSAEQSAAGKRRHRKMRAARRAEEAKRPALAMHRALLHCLAQIRRSVATKLPNRRMAQSRAPANLWVAIGSRALSARALGLELGALVTAQELRSALAKIVGQRANALKLQIRGGRVLGDGAAPLSIRGECRGVGVTALATARALGGGCKPPKSRNEQADGEPSGEVVLAGIALLPDVVSLLAGLSKDGGDAAAMTMVAEIAPGVSIDASNAHSVLTRVTESPPDPKVQKAILRLAQQLPGIDEHRAHAEVNGGALPPGKGAADAVVDNAAPAVGALVTAIITGRAQIEQIKKTVVGGSFQKKAAAPARAELDDYEPRLRAALEAIAQWLTELKLGPSKAHPDPSFAGADGTRLPAASIPGSGEPSLQQQFGVLAARKAFAAKTNLERIVGAVVGLPEITSRLPECMERQAEVTAELAPNVGEDEQAYAAARAAAVAGEENAEIKVAAAQQQIKGKVPQIGNGKPPPGALLEDPKAPKDTRSLGFLARHRWVGSRTSLVIYLAVDHIARSLPFRAVALPGPVKAVARAVFKTIFSHGGDFSKCQGMARVAVEVGSFGEMLAVLEALLASRLLYVTRGKSRFVLGYKASGGYLDCQLLVTAVVGGVARVAEAQLNLASMLAVKSGGGAPAAAAATATARGAQQPQQHRGHDLFDIARALAIFTKAVTLHTGAWSAAIATNVGCAVLRELQLEDAKIGQDESAVAALRAALKSKNCRLEVLG